MFAIRADPRRHAVAGVGRLRPGVRAGRAPAGAARLGGVPRLGEVPAAPVGPPPRRQPGAAARPAQPHPPRAAGARPPAHAALPRHRQPGAALLLEDRPGRRRPADPRRRQPRRPAPPAGLRRRRPEPLGLPYECDYDVVDQLDRRHVPLARRAQLRRARPVVPGPHLPRANGPRCRAEDERGGRARRRDPPRVGGSARTGTATRSSTSSTSAPSPTPTATASATSTGWPSASTTSPTSASRRSGCCRSTRRRCATTATTSPTTAPSTPTTATCASSGASSPPPTTATSG